MIAPQIGLLFIVLSLLFFGLSLWDFIKSKGMKTPARRAWLRIAVIFMAIGIFLFVTQATRSP